MKKFVVISFSLLFSISALANESRANTQTKAQRNCSVNADIKRNAIPATPNKLSLPQFGQGIIGWGTGPEGAEHKLNTVNETDIKKYQAQGVSLEMIKEWQAFYDNETVRNSCNPTAPLRAQLMKKIILLWH